MFRVNVVLAIVCLALVAPAFTLPAGKDEVVEQTETAPEASPEFPTKNDAENEVNGDINRDVETVGSPELGSDESTEVSTSSIQGQSGGKITITNVPDGEDFHCRKIVCPPGTETCEYLSTKLADSNNAEVHYKCTSSNGTVLLEKTETESAEEFSMFGGFPDIKIPDFFRTIESFIQEFAKNFSRSKLFDDSDE